MAVFGAALLLAATMLLLLTAAQDTPPSLLTGAVPASIPTAQAALSEQLLRQAAHQTALAPVRDELAAFLGDDEHRFGIYVEDLGSGAWIGINEGKPFEARSLIKLYLLVAILHDIEAGTRSLPETITVHAEDRDFNAGPLAHDAREEYALHELLEALIVESDNTAARALERLLDEESYRLVARLVGPALVAPDGTVYTTPEAYGASLRGVYRGAWLGSAANQYALSLLANTTFTEQLPAGVPPAIPVAHKIGNHIGKGIYHDCGIIYATQPYVLCVMSEEVTAAQAERVIHEAAAVTYAHFSR